MSFCHKTTKMLKNCLISGRKNKKNSRVDWRKYKNGGGFLDESKLDLHFFVTL